MHINLKLYQFCHFVSNDVWPTTIPLEWLVPFLLNFDQTEEGACSGGPHFTSRPCVLLLWLTSLPVPCLHHPQGPGSHLAVCSSVLQVLPTTGPLAPDMDDLQVVRGNGLTSAYLGLRLWECRTIMVERHGGEDSSLEHKGLKKRKPICIQLKTRVGSVGGRANTLKE